MSKTISSDLFHLIHCMSKAEKRHFKLYVRSHSKNMESINYILLFDIIAKQKEYDQEKIIQQGIVKKEHLHVLKNYLYNLVLESMRVLRSKGNGIDSQLNNMMENARMMGDKGLEEEEMKFLHKAKKLALKHERWGIALDALYRERIIILKRHDLKLLENFGNETEMLLNKLNNLQEYMMLHKRVTHLLIKGGKQRGSKNKALEKLIAHPLLRDEDKGLSVESKRIYYNTLSHYHSFMGNTEADYKILTKLLRLVEETGIEFPEQSYSGILNNLTIAQKNLGKYQEALSTIRKHRAQVWKSEMVKTSALLESYINETDYYLGTGEFKKGTIFIKEIENDMNGGKSEMPNAILLHYNFASIYFYVCDYHKALKWMNIIINRPHSNYREDVQAWAHLLRILIHYELNTPDILEHLIVSAHRFLLERNKLHKVEKSILNFIRRLSKTSAMKKELVEEFCRFKEEFVQIIKDPDEKKALDYFDLISWIESKIKNKKFMKP